MIEVLAVDQHGILLGFVLARQFWGNGYMSECIRQIIEWALRQQDIFRVWAFCDIENIASARAMEKAGMSREGLLKKWLRLPYFGDLPRDCYIYAAVREEPERPAGSNQT